MITEDYVSFEIAVLLKEKGFDIPCRQAYFNGSLVDYTMYGFCDRELLDCPSQSLALKCLREVNIIFGKKDHRLHTYFFKLSSENVLHTMTANHNPIKFFGFIKTDFNTLYNLFND